MLPARKRAASPSCHICRVSRGDLLIWWQTPSGPVRPSDHARACRPLRLLIAARLALLNGITHDHFDKRDTHQRHDEGNGRAVMGDGSGILVSVQIVTTTQTTLTSASLAKSQNWQKIWKTDHIVAGRWLFRARLAETRTGSPLLDEIDPYTPAIVNR